MCLAAIAPAIASATQAISSVGAGIGLAGAQALSVAGLGVQVAGQVQSGRAQAAMAEANARATRNQRITEERLAAVEESRTRQALRRQTATQRAELASRGVSLGSPTSILLGQEAARETAVAAQGVRSRAAARDAELSVTEQIFRREAALAPQRGRLSAAGLTFAAAPDLWPGLAATGS